MRGYVPGEQLNDPDIVKLNTNENPYPPSPRVFDAIRAALTGDKLRKYPQPLGDDFRKAAGRVLNVDPDGILIGNGSDDILTILTRAFVPEGGLIVSPTPSYILYKSLAEIQGARFETVRFDENGTQRRSGPEVEPLLLPNRTRLRELRPRSVAFSNAAQCTSHRARRGVCRFRGRRIEPSGDGPTIITRTLSKSYSLAGIRFGFAIARPEVVRELVKVKDSYNCDVLSLAAATAAIEDQDYFREVRAKIIATRERMRPALAELGFDVTPSHANFLWCRRADRPVKPIYEELKRRKILVRYMNYDGYDGLRISVGTDAEIDVLAELQTM